MSRFRRRLMGLSALRQAAADDFVRVEYIENTSKAYIQTDIIPNAQTGLKTKAYFTDTRDVYFVGLRNDGGYTRWGIGHNGAGFYYGYGKYQDTNRLVDTKGEFYLNYKNDKKFITIDLDDSSTLTSNLPNLSFTPKFGIRIFGGAGSGSGADTIVKSRIYYLQITQGSEIIRDFIPMYQISTDTYGLWDRIKGKFYTSPNGAKFVGGEPVIADANENLYYFRNYIDLLHNSKMCSIGLYPNFPADGFEAKIYWPKSGKNYVMGAWTNSSHNQFAPYTLNGIFYVSYHMANMNPMGNKMPENEILTIKAIPNKLTNKFEVYLNGIFKTSTPLVTTTATNKPFYIGKINGASNGAVRGTKLYSLKYWRNKELVRDYIPVERCSDGVFGLFDKVRNVFQVSEVNPFTGA